MSAMQTFSTAFEDQRIARVVGEKRQYGLIYGAVTGAAFALALWGWDGYLLSRAHALYPWLKLLLGLSVYLLLGSCAGALAARYERGDLAFLFWLVAALPLAWLTIALPLQIMPRVVSFLQPGLEGLIQGVSNESLGTRFILALVWAAIFLGIAGLLQLSLTESAVFSAAVLGKVFPLLVCLILAAIHGAIVDSLANEPLRSALLAMENTLEFHLEHEGQRVDPAVARQLHLGALGPVQELVERPWRLIVARSDARLGEIEVIVQFPHGQARCNVLYNQPAFCQPFTQP